MNSVVSGWRTRHSLLKPTRRIRITGTTHADFSVGMARRQVGSRLFSDIVWKKPNPPPNLDGRCLAYSTEANPRARNAETDQEKSSYTYNVDGRRMKNRRRLYAVTVSQKSLGKYPTPRPSQLVGRCLGAAKKPGDLIFDPVASSCTTGVAALTIDRPHVGCELGLDYVALIKSGPVTPAQRGQME